ncbi:MAG: hypothetical protein WDZ77_02430 [Candidatus Pacearchaeota archaeon]
MRRVFLFARVFAAFLLLISPAFTISADVISLNAGGDENLAITPDAYLEGFFFSEQPSVPDDGDDAGSGGGGGAEGGGGVSTILLDPSELNINLAVNTNIEREILVMNSGNNSVNLSISQENLDGLVLFEDDYIVVEAGQSVSVSVVFIALDETGIFTGKIKIGGQEVLVTINISTILLLFDSNIVVLNRDYIVEQGEDLRTQVTLVPLGEDSRLDVTLNYEIKDFNGKVYLTRSETVLIENELNFRRNFDTGNLPVGNYIIGLELIYPNGVAPSSASFLVVEKEPISVGDLIFYLIVSILIVGIFILIILIIRRRRKRKQQGSANPTNTSNTSTGGFSSVVGQPL